jgi:RND family efflux transporter MFP subunit
MARFSIAQHPKSAVAVGIVVVAAGVYGWTLWNKPAGPQGGRGAREAVPIKVTKIQKMSIQRQVDLSGTLLSIDQAKVSAEAAGVIREIPIQIGSVVAAGAPLAVLDKREYQLALDRAESALRQTRAQLGMTGPLGETDTAPADEDIASARNAQATYLDAKASAERAKVLATRGLLAPSELQTTDTRLKVAEAAYQSASDTVRGQKALLQDRRASYNLALKKLNDTVVRAPFAGAVADRPIQVGEFIAERTVVATIVRVNPLKVRTGAQERHAGSIQPGQDVQFRVESYGDTVFRGKVAYVAPSLDQTMRTFTVEALVDNADQRLKPGFFAKGVIFTKKDEGVMAVPDTAISTLAGVSSVYVIVNNKVKQSSVTLGVRQGELWEIVDGLKGDEVLANNRLNELATGMTVRIGSGDEGGGGRSGGAAGGRSGGRGGGQRGGGAGRSGGQRGQGGPGGQGGQRGGE